MSELRVHWITRWEELNELKGEWLDLWEQCPRATPFQSPHWLLNWWRYFGEGTLFTLALRKQGKLVGLAPLYIYRDPLTQLRQVFLMGTGNSDYLDFLVEDSVMSFSTQLIMRELLQRNDSWDVCDFQQLRGGSPLLELSLPKDFVGETEAQDVCPVLQLPKDAEGLSRTVPNGFLDRVKYSVRRAVRTRGLKCIYADTTNLDEQFEVFLKLHDLRWSRDTSGGVLKSESVRSFHHDVCRSMLRRASLRLLSVWMGPSPIASLYGFHHNHRTYFYLSGFDPEYSRFSPGTLALAHYIEDAIQEGAFEFDFLRGEEPYKFRWGAVKQFNYRLRVRRE